VGFKRLLKTMKPALKAVVAALKILSN